MKKALLTDQEVRELRPRATAYKVADPGERGKGRLLVRVRVTGAKDFFYRYRSGTTDRLVAIGQYDPEGKKGLTLAKARDKARKHADTKRDHGDVKAHIREEKRRKDVEARRGTLGDLLQGYAASLVAAGKVSARKVELALRKHVERPHRALWRTHAANIEPADVRDILAKMVENGCKRQMNCVRSYLAAAFAWGAQSDNDPRAVAAKGKAYGLKGNPVALVPRVKDWDDNPGTRELSDEELAAYWAACGKLPPAQRDCLRFLLALGGQRGMPVLRAPWSAYHFDDDELHLVDTKGRGKPREHILPLTPLALEQLTTMRSVNATAPGPFSSDAKTLLRLETLTNAVTSISVSLTKEHDYAPFGFGDIRRTCETTLARLGVSKDVRAWLLSHGRASDVQAKHYDMNTYLPEKRAALHVWSAHLLAIQKPKTERGASVHVIGARTSRSTRRQ
jgi:integrase